ncbi:hypothetical protein P0082_04270 [Candidatus Haliotispira prima]|uniref:DUF1700 domain-containing protein n=1 Tax=Candidatus Haliotispira prima TaxID=3034016 RepID=A0ABY8MJ91_9SPIO|nr:hypothetical protein P0082_04270 [Candidatus Haliotispira prima]
MTQRKRTILRELRAELAAAGQKSWSPDLLGQYQNFFRLLDVSEQSEQKELLQQAFSRNKTRSDWPLFFLLIWALAGFSGLSWAATQLAQGSATLPQVAGIAFSSIGSLFGAVLIGLITLIIRLKN